MPNSEKASANVRMHETVAVAPLRRCLSQMLITQALHHEAPPTALVRTHAAHVAKIQTAPNPQERRMKAIRAIPSCGMSDDAARMRIPSTTAAIDAASTGT